MRKVLLLDVYNLIHRARTGFTSGDHAIVYNFFRGLRPIIALHDPDDVYFVLEGIPTHRVDLLPEYKGDRVSPGDSFHRQKKEIIKLVSEAFPFIVSRANDLECDDLIGNIARYWDSDGLECTVVSGDSDFIQLLDDNRNIKLWHPIKKKYIEKPDYDYVKWKALTGDKSDNIPGIKGVGSKTAEKLCLDDVMFHARLEQGDNRKLFERNMKLIAFVTIPHFRPSDFTISCAKLDKDKIYNVFNEYGFKSMLKESTWKNFIGTFES